MSAVAEQREQRGVRLAGEDAAAWNAYADGCRAGASSDERRTLFDAALESLRRLADFDREP